MSNKKNDKIEVTLGGHLYKDVEVKFGFYVNGETAIQLLIEDKWGQEPLAVATVNLEQLGEAPDLGCVFIKDYAENEGMLESLTKAGMVEPTTRVVSINNWGTVVRQARLLEPWFTAMTEAAAR